MLKLDDNYRVVVADKLNFSLERLEEVLELKSKKPTGEFKWKNIAYVGLNLNHAIKRYSKEVQRDGVEHSDLLDKLKHLEDMIDRIATKDKIVFIPKERKKDE
jgi:hypothetical protein